MSNDSVWSNIFNRRSESEEAHAIRKVPIFENLSPKEITADEKLVHKRSYVTDEEIFR